MICVSIGAMPLSDCLRIVQQSALAEIRLDLNTYTMAEIATLFGAHRGLIATCRPGPFSDEARQHMLCHAIASGAAYVDIELEASAAIRRHVLRCAAARHCQIIVSVHDFTVTPPLRQLKRLQHACFAAGADIAKIACQATTMAHTARMLSLYDYRPHTGKRTIAIAMGPIGAISRLTAPLLGAPFTYAAATADAATAPGQFSVAHMESLLQTLRSVS